MFQVFKTCGDRGEEGTPSSISEEPKKKGSTVTALEYKPSPKSAARLEVQVCVWQHQFLAYFYEFYTLLCFYTQFHTSVFVIPRSQTCPVNSRKCNFTGSNSLRLCAVVKQHPQPVVINAGMASPKPGITSFGANLKIFSFYNEMCPFSWSVHVICS